MKNIKGLILIIKKEEELSCHFEVNINNCYK